MPFLAGLAFLAELLLLLGAGVAGWSVGGSTPVSVGLAVALPLLVVLVWAKWCAPRSLTRLRRAARLTLKTVLFTGVFLMLLPAEPRPGAAYLGLVMWLLFLISMPADRDPVAEAPGLPD